MKGGNVHTEIDRAKQEVRERIWNLLDAQGSVHSASAHGRIPHFRGAEDAAARLAELPVWQSARTVKAVPDKAQLPVRARALSEGRTVFMAVPKLADPRPFYLLDPAQLTRPPAEAASSGVAAQFAPKVSVDTMPPIDLVVVGSVAVDRKGTRVGKGAGYSDLEFAFLTEAGLISQETTVVTTVHGSQVLDEDLPSSRHDFGVDLIVTPDGVIACHEPHRPRGLVWDDLTPTKIAAIPALAARAAQRTFRDGPAA